MKSLIAAAALSAALFASPIFDAPQAVSKPALEFKASTTDNLTLALSENGQVQGVKVDGLELADKSIKGGFFVRDLETEDKNNLIAGEPGFEKAKRFDDYWRIGGVRRVRKEEPASFDSRLAYSGKRSLRLCAREIELHYKSKIQIQSKKEYAISAFSRGEGGYELAVNWYDSKGEGLGQNSIWVELQPWFTWKRYRGIFKAPQGAASAEVSIYAEGEVWLDDISFYELMPELDLFLEGTVKEKSKGIIELRSRRVNDLRLSARLIPMGEYIKVSGQIKGTTVRDRVIQLSFRLPINAQGGVWWDDFQDKRQIGGDEVYFYGYTEDYPEDRPDVEYWYERDIQVSLLPVSAVDIKGKGITIAQDMRRPSVMRFLYSRNKGYRVEYDFGLARQTNPRFGEGRNTASFEFYIYRHDPRYGMRSALKRYFDFFPANFIHSIPDDKIGIHISSYLLEHPRLSESYKKSVLKNFSVSFLWGATLIGRKYGLYTLYYNCPKEWWRDEEYGPGRYENLYGGVPTRKEALELLSYDLKIRGIDGEKELPRKTIARAVLNSMLYESDNKTPRLLNGEASLRIWDGTLMLCYSTNADPDIPGGMGEVTFKGLTAPYLSKDYEDVGIAYDDCYLGTEEGIDPYDHRRAHFAYTDFPLSVDYKTKKPAILIGISQADYLKKYEQPLRRKGKISFGNTVEGRVDWWFAPYLDAFSPEIFWAIEEGRNNPFSYMKHLRRLQTLAYRKLVIAGILQETLREGGSLEEYIKRNTFYGILTSFERLDKRVFVWRYRALFKKYQPLVRELQIAGWEPLTYAVSSHPLVWIERFGANRTGANQPYYFTIWNESRSAATVNLTIDLQKLKLNRPLKVTELIHHSKIEPALREGKMTIANIHIRGKGLLILRVNPVKRRDRGTGAF